MGKTVRVGEFVMNPETSDYLVVLVTAASEQEAKTLAKELLNKKLAACVNSFPVQSTYLWEGSVQQEQEFQLIIKTSQACFSDLEKAIVSLHSYDVPEIIAIPIIRGSQAYLNWLSSSLH